MAKRPGGVMVQTAEPTRSQLIPLITKWEEIGKKAQLAPGIFCIAVFFALVAFGSTDPITIPLIGENGNPINPLGWIYTSPFLIILGFFLTVVSLYFIYRLVGKDKPWWILLGAMAFTAYFLWLMTTRGDFLWLYDFFHQDLAGGEPDEKGPFLQLFVRHVLGTGFFEEFVKAIPALLLVWLGRFMSPSLRSKIGVDEPLDGILICAAAGGGFAIIETLAQYVPHFLAITWLKAGLTQQGIVGQQAIDHFFSTATLAQLNYLIQKGAALLATDPGIARLIIRSIDLAFGHMAYSGYFGYFIGLSVIRPAQRWKILLIGLLSASIPHALWDSVLSLDMAPLSAASALLSYVVLAAAILKAREISPNHSLLQPSIIFGGAQTSGAQAASYRPAVPVQSAPPPPPPVVPTPVAPRVPVPPQPPPARMATIVEPHPSLSAPAREGGNRLRVGTRYLAIMPGLRLLEHQVPGLEASSPGGLVAEVTRNPNEPSILGLTNLSTSEWEVVSASGARRQIVTGQTIRLALGTKIDFGSTDGEVG